MGTARTMCEHMVCIPSVNHVPSADVPSARGLGEDHPTLLGTEGLSLHTLPAPIRLTLIPFLAEL